MHVRTRYDLYTRTAHQDQNYVQGTSYETTGFACLYPHTNHTPRPARAERPQAARPPSVQLLCDRVGPDHVVVEDVLEVRRYDRSRRRARRPPYRADATGSKSSRCVTEMRLPEPPAVLVTMIRLAVRYCGRTYGICEGGGGGMAGGVFGPG